MGTDYRGAAQAPCRRGELVYTGPIDEYFDHCHGPLPYRSLAFQAWDASTRSDSSLSAWSTTRPKTPYTRITEYKHLTGQRHRQDQCHVRVSQRRRRNPTIRAARRKTPRFTRRYQALADERPHVLFVGRLATYRYYNMDQVVAQALTTRTHASKRSTAPGRPSAGAANRRGGLSGVGNADAVS